MYKANSKIQDLYSSCLFILHKPNRCEMRTLFEDITIFGLLLFFPYSNAIFYESPFTSNQGNSMKCPHCAIKVSLFKSGKSQTCSSCGKSYLVKMNPKMLALVFLPLMVFLVIADQVMHPFSPLMSHIVRGVIIGGTFMCIMHAVPDKR